MSRKIILVTGASRGIGLASEGHFVIGTATGERGAEVIEEYLSESGGIGRVLDVCDDTAIDKLFEEIDSVYGSVNVLVNNAGITKDGLLMRMKDEDWASVLDTNLTAIYRMTVNCVAPGFVETDMTEELDERLVSSMLDAVPLGRMAQPDEIATAVSFLASDGASYITGEVLAVNGGMYM